MLFSSRILLSTLFNVIKIASEGWSERSLEIASDVLALAMCSNHLRHPVQDIENLGTYGLGDILPPQGNKDKQHGRSVKEGLGRMVLLHCYS